MTEAIREYALSEESCAKNFFDIDTALGIDVKGYLEAISPNTSLFFKNITSLMHHIITTKPSFLNFGFAK